jgi:hypothetical protein
MRKTLPDTPVYKVDSDQSNSKLSLLTDGDIRTLKE